MNYKKKIVTRILLVVLAVIVFTLFFNLRVPTKQGVNYKVSTLSIPLYLKAFDFIDRNLHYKYLAHEVTLSAHNKKEKVLQIFAWTRQNIKTDIPSNYPIVDDHVWHIIVRGYGVADQINDVFTTLCVYAGIPAFWSYISPKGALARFPISYVEVNNRCLVFDLYYGNYFKNKDGEIASVDDIINDRSLINQANNKPIISGIDYVRYFENLKPVDEMGFLRAQTQMPILRIYYEIKKLLRFPEKIIGKQ
jgi:hypothetical protein